jgi:hypothetical protein
MAHFLLKENRIISGFAQALTAGIIRIGAKRCDIPQFFSILYMEVAYV